MLVWDTSNIYYCGNIYSNVHRIVNVKGNKNIEDSLNITTAGNNSHMKCKML